MVRQVVLDTETTGIDFKSGHRVIEIGCVEIINRKFTGSEYQTYLNPDRDIDEGAAKVHGLTLDFLQDKPRFIDIVGKINLDICLAFLKMPNKCLKNH